MTSGIDSRKRQKAARCALLAAKAASTSTCQRAALPKGAAWPVSEAASATKRPDMNSKACSVWPSWRRKARSSSGRASKRSSATQAAAGCPVGGCRRSTSRVMMPSVPSEPMNRKRGSSPLLFLTSRLRLLTTVPSASTASTPSTASRMVP